MPAITGALPANRNGGYAASELPGAAHNPSRATHSPYKSGLHRY